MKNKSSKTENEDIIPAELIAKIMARAKLEKVSASYIVERALRRDLKQHRVKPNGRTSEEAAA